MAGERPRAVAGRPFHTSLQLNLAAELGMPVDAIHAVVQVDELVPRGDSLGCGTASVRDDLDNLDNPDAIRRIALRNRRRDWSCATEALGIFGRHRKVAAADMGSVPMTGAGGRLAATVPPGVIAIMRRLAVVSGALVGAAGPGRSGFVAVARMGVA
jgi:hypothetical protein